MKKSIRNFLELVLLSLVDVMEFLTFIFLGLAIIIVIPLWILPYLWYKKTGGLM